MASFHLRCFFRKCWSWCWCWADILPNELIGRFSCSPQYRTRVVSQKNWAFIIEHCINIIYSRSHRSPNQNPDCRIFLKEMCLDRIRNIVIVCIIEYKINTSKPRLWIVVYATRQKSVSEVFPKAGIIDFKLTYCLSLPFQHLAIQYVLHNLCRFRV